MLVSFFLVAGYLFNLFVLISSNSILIIFLLIFGSKGCWLSNMRWQKIYSPFRLHWVHWWRYVCANCLMSWNFLLLFIYQWSDVSEGARSALRKSGTLFGSHPIRVLLSKTAIAPVNPTFLPKVSWDNHF